MPFLHERQTIQQLSQLLNLPKSTIRFWEKTIGTYLSPERTQGGQRRYSKTLMERYKHIRDLRAQGQSLEQIKRHIAIPVHAVAPSASHELAEKIAEHIGAVVSRELYRLLTNENANAVPGNGALDDSIVSASDHRID